MRFLGNIKRTGANTTGIEVPLQVIESLGAGKRPPVAVTINDYTYRTTIGTVDGGPMISVSAAVRSAANVNGGDEVTVTLELDAGPREVSVPAELLEAMAKEPLVLRAFNRLSRSKKQRYTLPIDRAKTQTTRERNIKKALDDLRKTLG